LLAGLELSGRIETEQQNDQNEYDCRYAHAFFHYLKNSKIDISQRHENFFSAEKFFHLFWALAAIKCRVSDLAPLLPLGLARLFWSQVNMLTTALNIS
jgi:hypothetical protein